MQLRYLSERCESDCTARFVRNVPVFIFLFACLLVAQFFAVIIIKNKSDEECGFVVVRSTGTLTALTVFIFVVSVWSWVEHLYTSGPSIQLKSP